ncbi:DUF5977 domain-containing protein [Mucilaginibacter ginsenosidivorans]|uniref:DUF5977 domain-containing protein n=1 Tax=Mucilaginibacter ginsenosidivorans TaxID=398053 RepID=A0A5B8USR9_9SPHI|nr:DUF5977 domain-containing protein [Mucilaginibacter ginsenosidivorans]QEC61755.1 hypothetical protein FRZ54_03860 [Mucilaginibacter ginsenosidivorans]
MNLSYHASGNKVTDVASWVGLGWSVQAGGAVTRHVMGGPDDDTYGYLRGYLRYAPSLDMTVDTDMDYADRIAYGLYDGRPDIYSFDYPGHSGKFFFNGKNAFKPVLLPSAPVGIKYTLGSTALTNFTLTDEQGNIAFFGDTATETTQTAGAGAIHTPINSSWLLERMISQNRRDTVSFAYGSDLVFYPDATSQMQVITDYVAYTGGTPPNPYHASNVPGPTTSISTQVAEKPLTEIDFKNGKVVFEKEDTVRKDINQGVGNNVHALNRIVVYEYNYNSKMMEVQKTIVFYKSYFGTAAANNFRLRLDSIQILDKAGSIIEHYRFKYNRTELPFYQCFARDYWGYYNGKEISNTLTSLIPYMTVPYDGGTTTIGGTVPHNRDCDSNYMQASVLDTIYYPTGGYTTFTYQSNQFTNPSGQLRVAGGLRVTSIKSYDNVNATPIVRTYRYNIADSNYFLQYSFYAAPVQTHRYYVLQQQHYESEYQCNVSNYVSNPNIDLEPFDAATVVYPDVSEYIGTPAANVGRIRYIYSFDPDNLQSATIAGTPVVTTHFYNRGLLLSKSQYIRKSDGSYQIAKKDSNFYATFPEQQYNDVGFVSRKRFTNEGAAVTNVPLYPETLFFPNDYTSGAYIYSNYFINSEINLLTQTNSYIYDINDPTKYTTSIVSYTYSDTTHLQIAKTKHVDSKGNTHVTINKYPFDYLSGSTTHNQVLDSMVNRHMYASVVEKWDSLKNVTTSVNSITGAQLNTYQLGSITGTIVPGTISTLSVSSPVTNFAPMTINSGTGAIIKDSRYVQMISFDHYDNKNNLASYTPRNATSTAILWDYLYENPVAQVKNGPYISGGTGYAYTSFEADGQGNWIFTGTPVTDLTAPTGSKVYPLGTGNITSTFSVSGKAGIISYWSNGGAATVVCSGTTVTGTAMTTIGGWTYYEHVTPAGPFSITISGSVSIDELRLYPKDAQMTTFTYSPDGLTAMADTKGGINHFEYDYFARLKNIKDFYGNIVNNYYYHTYDQTIGNDAMSHSYTRTTCPPNTTPGSLTYAVPVNKYYSSTKASANAEAGFEMATNGQAKANQNCGCPPIMVNVTLTNSTGISGFQATFNGVAPYNFPSTGSTIIQVQQGTYATVSINAVGSATHTFKLTGFTDQTGHSASWSTVSVTSGSSLTLTVQ